MLTWIYKNNEFIEISSALKLNEVKEDDIKCIGHSRHAICRLKDSQSGEYRNTLALLKSNGKSIVVINLYKLTKTIWISLF